MRLFSQTETELFESLFHDKLQAIRDRHFAEVNRIQRSNVQHKLNLLISEHLRFKKEFTEARVQAYLETCGKLGRYPNQLDAQELAAELTGLAKGGTDDISRTYKDPLGPVQAQSLEKTMERLETELGQIISPAMSPVQRLVAEGKLARESANAGNQMKAPSKHVAAFYADIGRSCETLGDLSWSETSSYWERIPTDLERVDFLQELARLPDNGIVNNTIIDPTTHNRNTRTFLRPLHDECSRLLARRFNVEDVVRDSETMSDHAEAIDYLWRELRAFKKYHPGTQNGHYLPHEWRFCKRIEEEIQYRKDVQGASVNYSMNVGENSGVHPTGWNRQPSTQRRTRR